MLLLRLPAIPITFGSAALLFAFYTGNCARDARCLRAVTVLSVRQELAEAPEKTRDRLQLHRFAGAMELHAHTSALVATYTGAVTAVTIADWRKYAKLSPAGLEQWFAHAPFPFLRPLPVAALIAAALILYATHGSQFQMSRPHAPPGVARCLALHARVASKA